MYSLENYWSFHEMVYVMMWESALDDFNEKRHDITQKRG